MGSAGGRGTCQHQGLWFAPEQALGVKVGGLAWRGRSWGHCPPVSAPYSSASGMGCLKFPASPLCPQDHKGKAGFRGANWTLKPDCLVWALVATSQGCDSHGTCSAFLSTEACLPYRLLERDEFIVVKGWRPRGAILLLLLLAVRSWANA